MKNFQEYIGCIHAHSVYSDGSGTYPEIIRAAQESKLDYLMMSDHMTLEGREKGFFGWHDDLFLSIGYEIEDPQDQHHYLAFGLDSTLPPQLPHRDYIKAVERQGALGIAAHPFEERDDQQALPGYPPITWSSLDYPEVKVIEIWNMMSHWMEATTLQNKYWNVIHPRSFSTFPKRSLLEWWDQANLKRKVTGVGAVDVHATQIKILGLFKKAIFDYKIMFKSIHTHLLMDDKLHNRLDAEKVEQAMLNIIRLGRTFISNYRRGNARGFRFWAETSSETLQMGETGQAEKSVLRAVLPQKAHCKLIRNGQIYHRDNTAELKVSVPAGSYRLEVEKDQRGWIYSNHIKIKKA